VTTQDQIGRLMSKRKGNARVTDETVCQIRQLYHKGYTQASLSRHFSMSVNQIGKIVRGEAWQHLPLDGEGFVPGTDELVAMTPEMQSDAEATLARMMAEANRVANLGKEVEALRDSPPTAPLNDRAARYLKMNDETADQSTEKGGTP
jgi:hypothetical protein